ncbi:uncharacterized protein [Zea mays]|nr:uncharacterized protein LOC103649446 [Zea mays]|eukprot:XP_008671935.1 uncharacterized protein LOC103649446 [Zea mays]
MEALCRSMRTPPPRCVHPLAILVFPLLFGSKKNLASSPSWCSPPTEATADDAVLQRFALAPADPASNSTISFNVTATLSLRNPNMYRAIEYGALGVTFSFNGTRFDDSASVPGFKHKARKTATRSVRVGGVGKPIKLTRPGVGEFRAENDTGSFGVEMRLDTMLQYKGRSHPTFTPPRVVATADLANGPRPIDPPPPRRGEA